MGCFDSVYAPCPKCGKEEEFQTKSGECGLAQYTLKDAPDAVMADVNRHAPAECEMCGTKFYIGMKDGRYASIPDTEGCVVTTRTAFATRIRQAIRSEILGISSDYGMHDDSVQKAEELSTAAYDWVMEINQEILEAKFGDIRNQIEAARERSRKMLDELTAEAEKHKLYDEKGGEGKGL